jgi:hypothetical protein
MLRRTGCALSDCAHECAHPVESVHIYHRPGVCSLSTEGEEREWMNEDKRERERERQGENTHTCSMMAQRE